MEPTDQDIKDHNDQVADIFDDLPPFSITIKTGHEAGWISSAMLLFLADGNADNAEKGLKLMIQYGKDLGAEKGVNKFFTDIIPKHLRYPAFLKPVFILLIAHYLKKAEELKEKLANEKKEDS